MGRLPENAGAGLSPRLASVGSPAWLADTWPASGLATRKAADLPRVA